jgi:thioredoxin-like negative regulator of GroEL
MNRFWIGVGLLLALLGASLWAMFAMDHAHGEISDILEQSAEAAQEGNWEQADRLIQNAKEQWEENWNFSAAMSDHTALDEIDSIFAQAEIYRKSRNAADFSATCARLAKLIEALEEGHDLSWWNLL